MNRIYYFDNAKYFLIISVVLGHLLQNNGLQDNLSVGLFDTIFMYSMPAFVFISGIFTPPHRDKKVFLSDRKFWLSELCLVETMIIFSITMKVPVLLISGMSLYEFLLPGYTLWYLLALVWWRLLTYLLPANLFKHKILLLSATVIISILSGFLTKGEHIALPRSLFFLPFFFAGVCCSNNKEHLMEIIKKIPVWLALIVILSVLFVNCLLNYNQLPFNTGNVPYVKWGMDIMTALLWRVIFSMLCVIITLAILRIIPTKKNIISEYGAESLVLYVFHAIILFSINLVYNRYELPGSTFIAISEFIVIVPLLMFISKTKFANMITSPITQILKRKI